MAVTENDLIKGPLVPANGVTTISLDYFFEREEWLEVYRTGSDVPLVLNTDYTVAGEGTVNGIVTLTTPANGTDSYSVYLTVPMERTSDLSFRGGFRSQPFNLELDRIWQAMQGLRTRLDRAFGVSRTSEQVGLLEAETAIGRASRYMRFSDDGSSLEVGANLAELSGFGSEVILTRSQTDALWATGNLAPGTVFLADGLPYVYDPSVSLADSAMADLGVAGVDIFGIPTPGHRGGVAGEADSSASLDPLNTSGGTIDLAGKAFNYTGSFVPVADIVNGKIIDTNGTHDFTVRTQNTKIISPQRRWRANYQSGTLLRIHGGENVSQNGMYFLNNYRKQGRQLTTGVNGSTDISAADGGDLGAETTRKLENWYGVFLYQIRLMRNASSS